MVTVTSPYSTDAKPLEWDIALDKDTVAVKGDVKGARWIQIESSTPPLLYAERLVAWFIEDVIGEPIQFPVTINHRAMGKRSQSVLGHFTLEPNWSTREGLPVWEMTLVSERFSADPRRIVTTILHEAVHVANFSRGDKDASKSGRHNETFKEMAEGAGIICEKDSKIGWTTPDISEELWDKVQKNCPVDASTFDLFANAWKAKPSRKSTKAYACQCDFKVRIPAKQTLDADCNVCGSHYEEDE